MIKVYINMEFWCIVVKYICDSFEISMSYDLNKNKMGNIVAQVSVPNKDYPHVVFSDGHNFEYIKAANENEPCPAGLHCSGSEDVAMRHYLGIEGFYQYRRQLEDAIHSNMEKAIDTMLTHPYTWKLVELC